MTAEDVACRDLVERITDLLDGALPPEEAAAARAHLEECAGCAAAVEQFRRTIAVLGFLPEDAVRALDPDIAASLVDAFRRRRG
jgi:anti-sigma factor RsiW